AEPAEAAAKPEELTAEKLFADEALSTPEGIKRARQILLAAKEATELRQRKMDRSHVKIRRREQAIGEREQAAEAKSARADKFIQVGQQFMQGMEIIRGARTAAPAEIMAMLDKLAGGRGDSEAGTRLAEEMLIAVHADGKAPPVSRTEKELRERVEALARQREADLAANQAEREAIEERGLKGSIAQGTKALRSVALNAQAYPSIAAAVADPESDVDADGVVSYLTEMLESHFEENREPLDWNTAIGMLEAKLARFYGQRPAQAANGSGQPQRPRTGAPRRGAPTTVLPASADTSSGRGRPLTHEERLDELARDPSFFEELGPAFSRHVGMR
ncbi:MAG TPA: hypothetical protein VF090_08240, partial [Methyloceanibacter sp.]